MRACAHEGIHAGAGVDFSYPLVSRLTERRNFRVGDNTGITQLLAPTASIGTNPPNMLQIALDEY